MSRTAKASPETGDSPRLTIVYKPLATLIPYARNARTHTDEQVNQIAASIREFGWTNPVLLDEEDGIIAGHGRVLAGLRLGYTEAPTVTLCGLTDPQRRAYVLADNKLALKAGWDLSMLAVELQELSDFDMSIAGFDPEELRAISSGGWDSDIDVKERDGENLAGIATVIRVTVDADSKQVASEVIVAALDAAGLTHEIR